MKYSPTNSLISPTTGRVRAKRNYVLIGDREDIATPSPALIDLRIDLQNFANTQQVMSTTDIVLGHASSVFPNAQILSELTNGIIKQNDGIVSTAVAGTDYVGTNLTKNYLLTGDNNNKVSPVQQIQLSNLPSLSLTPFTTQGQIYRGTISGVPEVSNSLTILEASVANLYSYNYITGSNNTSLPNSQSIANIQNGLLKHTNGILQHAVPSSENHVNYDYLDRVLLDIGLVGIGDGHGFLAGYTTIDFNHLPNLTLDHVYAGNANSRPVATALSNIYQKFNIGVGNLLIGGNTGYATTTKTITINNIFDIPNNQLITGGFDNRPVLVDKINITNLPQLNYGDLWQGDLNNNASATRTISLVNLPGLTQGYVWIGDVNGRPVERALDVAPNNAYYILQRPSNFLPNAQSLNALGAGMLKIAQLANGAISIAQGGVNPAVHDYITPTNYQEEHTARVARENELQGLIEAVQAQLAEFIGVQSWLNFVQLIADLVGAGFTAGYPEWLFQIKYKPLLTRYKINDTTSNYGNWQSGHIWFDSNVPDTAGHESGLRLTAWDSSTFFSETLKPLSLGIYGFLNQTGYLQEQRGFAFRSEFETNSNHYWYRGAKNFNLYRVVSRENVYGFLTKELWLECSYYELGNPKFRFHKEIDFNNVELYNVKTPSSDSSPTPKSWVLSEIANINKTVTLIGDVTGSGNLGTNIATNISNDRNAISNIYSLTFDTNLISSPVGHLFKVQLTNPSLQSATIFDEYKSIQSLGDNIFLGREIKVFNDNSGLHYVGYYARNPNQNWFFRCFAQNSDMYTKFEANVDFNNKILSNVPAPTLTHHAVNKSYVDNKTWTTSSITDFDTAVKAYKLSDFAIPTTNLNLNNYKITNLANPVNAQDAVNKSTLESYAVASVNGTANQINSTGGLTPILSLATSGVTAGSYTNANITVDSLGRITTASNGSSSTGTVTSVAVTGSTGLSVSGSPITTSGTIDLTLGSELQALSALASTGLLTRTASNTYTFSTITGTTSQISVANGNGVAGNPTISLIDTITAGTVSNPASITYDAKGRITAVTSGSTPVTSVTASGVLSSSGGTTPNITHNTSGVVGAVYNYPTSMSINATGHIQSVTEGTQPVTSVSSSTGLTASITSGQLNLSLHAELTALAQLNAGANLGLLVRNANAGYTIRNLVAGTGITIANPDGVAGNITISATAGSGVVTLIGDVTGSGNVGTNITTTLASKSLSYFSVPTADISFANYKITSLADATSDQDAMNRRSVRATRLNQFAVPNDFVNFNFQNLSNVADAGTSDYDAMNRRSVRATRLNEFALPNGWVDLNQFGLFNIADAQSDQDAMNRRSVRGTKLSQFSAPDGWINMNNYGLYNVANGQSNKDAVNLEQLNSFSGKTASISTTYTIFINSNNNSWAGYGFIGRVTNYSPSIVYEANSYHGYGLISQYEIAASQFHAFSSIKLKDVIEREQNKVETKAIDFIKKIPIVEYRHKDDTEDAQYFGVIAEELAKVDSTLIKNSFRFVPNFQLEAEVELIEEKNNQHIYLFKFQKNIEDIKFDGARLQFENAECIIENVELNTLKINTKNLIEKKIVKVYGTYEHCPNVHKERLFEASLSVIQNLLKRVEALEAQIV